jgi:adenylate cyclase
VRRQVGRLGRSEEFAASPRAMEFLGFVIEEMLAGRAAELTQRVVAARVYGRGADFDPSIDPVVRMQAGRIRRALEHYYLTVGKGDPIVISLPKGSYVPKVERAKSGMQTPIRTGGGSPVLLVIPFQNHSKEEEVEVIARGLGEELAVALDSYRAARVLLLPGDPHEDEAIAAETRKLCEGVNCYLVKGSVSWRAGSLRVAVRLEDGHSGVVRWSHEVRSGTEARKRDIFLDELVQRVAASIAEEQGVVAQQALPSLERIPPGEVNHYQALLHIVHAERSGTLGSFEKAMVVIRGAVQEAPSDGRLWTALARLSVSNWAEQLLPHLMVPIEEAIEYAEKGARLCVADQGAWCILSYAHTIAGDLKSGREAILTALAQNPDSLFFRDVIGYLLTLQGDWERGPAIAREAARLNPFVRDIVFSGLWLDAFRREDYLEAKGWSRRFLNSTSMWSPLMEATTLVHLGEQEKAERAAGQMLLMRPDFRECGPRLIRHYVKFEDLACRIEGGLRLAGLSF